MRPRRIGTCYGRDAHGHGSGIGGLEVAVARRSAVGVEAAAKIESAGEQSVIDGNHQSIRAFILSGKQTVGKRRENLEETAAAVARRGQVVVQRGRRGWISRLA